MRVRSLWSKSSVPATWLFALVILAVHAGCGKKDFITRGARSISPDGTKCCIITYPLSDHYNYITIECIDLEEDCVLMQIKHNMKNQLPEIPEVVWADDSSSVSTTYDLEKYGLSGENPFAFSYDFKTNSATCSAGEIMDRDGRKIEYGGKLPTSILGLSSGAKRVLKQNKKGKR